MESVEELAAKVWGLSRDSLLIHLRFLDVALSELEFRAQSGIGQVLCDMSTPRAVIVFMTHKCCCGFTRPIQTM